MRQITLTRHEAVIDEQRGAYRLRIDAEAVGPDIDAFIFLYELEPPSPYHNEEKASFAATVGPLQFDLPIDAPTFEYGNFFRKDTLTIDFPSLFLANLFWNQIVQDVQVLLRAMKSFDTLLPAGSFTFTDD
jgi:hypothetical protein